MQKLKPFGLYSNIDTKDHRFIGMYEDIIEYVDTGKVEKRRSFNDVTTLLSKQLQTMMMRDSMTLNSQSSFGLVSSWYTDTTKQSLNNIGGIFQWEIGRGLDGGIVTEIDTYLTNNSGDTALVDSTLKKLFMNGSVTTTDWSNFKSSYSQGWDTQTLWEQSGELTGGVVFNDILYDNYVQEFHNALFVRKYEQITGNTASNSYYRKEVETIFVEPVDYNDGTTTDTDPQNIIVNLLNSTYDIKYVTEWSPVEYVTPFIMVQQVFNQDEQNFTWREFSLVQGEMPQTIDDTWRQGQNPQQNVSDTDFIDVTSENTELKDLLKNKQDTLKSYFTDSNPSYLVDYKIHKQISKTSNMKITRRIVFGFLPFSTQY